MLDILRTEWAKCQGVKVEPYYGPLAGNHHRIIVTTNPSTGSDLEHALDCLAGPLPPALVIKIHRPTMNEGLMGTDHELQIELAGELSYYIRQVKVSLPGKMESVPPLISTGVVSVTSTHVSQDTILWQIHSPRPRWGGEPALPATPVGTD